MVSARKPFVALATQATESGLETHSAGDRGAAETHDCVGERRDESKFDLREHGGELSPMWIMEEGAERKTGRCRALAGRAAT